jgi:alanine-glyoxylate transaminase / serine-glyoxylate transaminase / serine-pyruvate transaminase
VEAGDEVLVINAGYFGDSFGDCLACYGARVTQLRVADGSAGGQAGLGQARPYKLDDDNAR